MLLSAFSEAFSAPNPEIAHAGRVEWRGGGLSPPLLLSSIHAKQMLRNSDASHFERNSPCREAQGLSRSEMPEA
jgi:hypothetical protein